MNLILLSQNTLFINIKIINLSKGNRQLAIKFFSSRLNIKPYNKLDKEVINSKKYKEELITLHNTECPYLGARILKE